MRLRVLTMIGLLALGGCMKKSDFGKGDTPPEPPEPAANFQQDFDGRGLDPAFGLKLRRGTEITLTRPGQPDVVATAPGGVIQVDQASWTAPMADGQTLKVVIYASSCTEGADGTMLYPYSVEVDLPGQSPMGGCAGKPTVRKPGH